MLFSEPFGNSLVAGRVAQRSAINRKIVEPNATVDHPSAMPVFPCSMDNFERFLRRSAEVENF